MRDQHLTLEQKIGQLFVVGFQGREPDAETCALLDTVQPGGFVLFQRNIESFDQVYDLTSRLRELSPIPPLLAIDHEGGRVDRLKHIFTMMPSMAELASAGTASLRAGARIIAAELAVTGLNLALAPVIDLRLPGAIFGDRCLASDPGEVARLATAFIEELSKRDIFTCAKHFPGLGGATVDPHFALPRIERTKKQLQQEDAAPFIKVFHHADMIMISHAYYAGLGDDKPVPGCLSNRIVNGSLRRKLGYKGLAITDDLTMGAVTGVGLTPELFLRAFEAGNDLLLFSQTTPLLHRAFRTILSEARKSAVLRRRVDESLDRILEIKKRIEFVPLRYRSHLQSRITRQIEKLRKSVIEVGTRALTV
jgi:beta-N-acetylhexosaminidase